VPAGDGFSIPATAHFYLLYSDTIVYVSLFPEMSRQARQQLGRQMSRTASIGFRQNWHRTSAPVHHISRDQTASWTPHPSQSVYPARGVLLGSLLGSGMWLMLAAILSSKGIL
jgi:hypothetical protein